MRFTDRLINEQRKNHLQQERQTDNQQEENQEDETGMTYQPRPRWGFLNDTKGIFAEGRPKGINSEPSVFDKTAIFHVKRKEEDNGEGNL